MRSAPPCGLTRNSSGPRRRRIRIAGGRRHRRLGRTIAHGHGALLACDNTFATPALQQPLSLGADAVMHSTTKYLGGHSDVMGGALVFAKADALFEAAAHRRHITGSIASPFNSWLILRGARSLPARMAWHCRNAMRVAEFLAEQPEIEAVNYRVCARTPAMPSLSNRCAISAACCRFNSKAARRRAPFCVAGQDLHQRHFAGRRGIADRTPRLDRRCQSRIAAESATPFRGTGTPGRLDRRLETGAARMKEDPADTPLALPQLTTPTWEMELLISAASAFALLQVLGVQQEAFLRMAVWFNESHMQAMLTPLYLYARIVLICLSGAFIIHLATRAYWVGLIGLNSIFPDGPDFSKFKYGAPVDRRQQARYRCPDRKSRQPRNLGVQFRRRSCADHGSTGPDDGGGDCGDLDTRAFFLDTNRPCR